MRLAGAPFPRRVARGALVGFTLLALSGGQGPAGSPAMPEVVAIVNGKKIGRSILERRIEQSRSMNPKRMDSMSPEEKKRAMERVLKALVIQELEYQEAVNQKIVVPEAEVEARLSREIKTFGGYEEFEKSLAGGNITIGEWRRETKRALMIARLEEKAAGGTLRSEWLKQRPSWLSGLASKAQIWIWKPDGKADVRSGAASSTLDGLPR